MVVLIPGYALFEESDPSAILVVSLSYSPLLLNVKLQSSISNLKQTLDTLDVCELCLSLSWGWATEIGEKMLFLLHFEESDPSAILVVSLSYSPVLLNVKLQSSISNLKQTLDTLDVCELCLSLSWGWATEIGEKMLFLLHFEESDPSAILVVSLSYSPLTTTYSPP